MNHELIKRYFPEITEHKAEQYERLGELYAEWNSRINVISRKDMEHLYTRHILHSLAIAKVCRFEPGAKVVDIGCGGGFPSVAMSAALERDIPITEYAPLKIKMAITGNGQASKEQVADMLKRMLKLDNEMTGPFLDATDALAAAYCHYLQMDRPVTTKAYSSWKDFIAKNPGKVVK